MGSAAFLRAPAEKVIVTVGDIGRVEYLVSYLGILVAIILFAEEPMRCKGPVTDATVVIEAGEVFGILHTPNDALVRHAIPSFVEISVGGVPLPLSNLQVEA